MNVSVAYDFLPKQRSVNASIVMDHFGIDFEQGRHVIAENIELPIQLGDVVFFTGPSGSGKSSLMRAVAEVLDQQRAATAATEKAILRIEDLDLGETILVDGLGMSADEALGLLAHCGLSEAQLLLRTPAELSDGQRYRFRIAKALSRRPRWVMADEFTASLDRTLAKVIAYNVRRLSDRRGIGFLLATTHDDILEDLNPNVLVRCDLEGTVQVERRAVKKNESVWRMSYGSARVPRATGVTSLGGITAATRSASAGG